ncbi:MAG: HAMP domain-containing histidine kinase [Actinomycetota bacterium]|nr:HAMP domain-containing histidine kinase [Actinomycetota bacterium]
MRETAPSAATGVGGGGAATIAVVASFVGMSARDILLLSGIAAGAALVTSAVGVVALRGLRRRPLGQQVMAVALTVILSCAVGAWAAAWAMFISLHDLAALAVVLVSAATVAALVALPLAHRFAAEGQALVVMARRIAEQGQRRDPARQAPEALGPDPPFTRELARLATELERVADELTRTREREKALEASRRELIAWVSHDLRTPLSAIRAVAQALEDRVVSDPETIVRYHRTLRAETDRLTALVDDLFALSRAQAGVSPLPLERVSLEDLVSDALAAASPVAHSKGLRLHGRLDGPSPEVEVSARDVSRALGNLLDNAIRHSPPGAAVGVRAGADGRGVYIAVTDVCGGIPESHLGRVFDVAFTGTAARTPGDEAGAGLGLAIARGIAEAHGGSIAVRNKNSGCCFELRLPQARSSAPVDDRHDL